MVDNTLVLLPVGAQCATFITLCIDVKPFLLVPEYNRRVLTVDKQGYEDWLTDDSEVRRQHRESEERVIGGPLPPASSGRPRTGRRLAVGYALRRAREHNMLALLVPRLPPPALFLFSER